MGIGDWGLGIGDWGLGIGPNPQSPIPNPQTPIPIIMKILLVILFNIYITKNKYIFNILKPKKYLQQKKLKNLYK